MSVRSAYEILGVPRDADPTAIRTAYRAFVRTAHPDRHSGSSEANERFLEVQAAYEVLIDPDRRAIHDADPRGTLADQLSAQRRKAQLRRRRERLRRLYE